MSFLKTKFYKRCLSVWDHNPNRWTYMSLLLWYYVYTPIHGLACYLQAWGVFSLGSPAFPTIQIGYNCLVGILPACSWCKKFKFFFILAFNQAQFTRLRSAVGNVSGYRYMSDCRSRGREFDPSPVPYFRGDWSWNNLYRHSPLLCWFKKSESMCRKTA